MTNVMISPVSNKPDVIPFHSTLSFEFCEKLQNHSSPLLKFAMGLLVNLTKNDNVLNAISIDASFVKKEYSKNTYSKHMKALIEYNIIMKVGNNKSWIYYINPAFGHKLEYNQQNEFRKNYRYLFDNIAIP